MKIKDLEKKISEASSLYYSGSPIMSDEEFDVLVDQLRNLSPNSNVLKLVGSAPDSNFIKKKHEIPMGSLLKVNTFEELTSFGKKYSSKDEFVYSEKIDGLSVSLYYKDGVFVEALTRGDGEQGEVISNNVSKMKFLKKLKNKYTGYIRGEIYLDLSDFEKFFKDGKNPRNVAAGTVRRLDGVGCEHLSILCYWINADVQEEIQRFELIEKLGLRTPKYGIGTLNEIQKVWKEYEDSKRAESSYEIDGICVYANLIKDQVQQGVVDGRPRFARAYKFSPQIASSVITAYQFQVGRTGRLTPVAFFNPVNLSGATISKATLHNNEEIKRLNLKMGSIVTVQRRGDVIPKITSAHGGKGSIIFPKNCPSCNSALIESEMFLVCTEKKCREKNILSLLFWLQTIGIKGIGDKLVEKLYDSGIVKEIKDFYSMTKEDLMSIERMADKSAKKVILEIKSKMNIKPELFLKGIGIERLGESVSKKLFEKFSLNDLAKIKESDLEGIEGIGPELKKVIIDGFKERGAEILELSKIITLDEFKKSSNTLNSKVYVFSEIRDKDLEDRIQSNGGKVSSSVSKKTTCLIVKSKDGESSKISKAKELGVLIMTLDEFKKSMNLY